MALSPDNDIKQAQALARRGQTQQAKQLYQALLEQDPDNQQARDELAALDRRSAQFQALTALFQRGDLADVVREGEALARQYPDVVFLHNIVGNAHAGLEQWNDAAECYICALRIRPDIAETHVNLGKVLSQLGRREDAMACFKTALRIKPGYADAHYSLGVVLRDLKHYADAIASFVKAIEARPDFAEAHDNMGICLRHLERYEEAIACFNAALKLKPGLPATYVQLGIALAKAGRYPESNAALTKALSIRPTLADAHAQRLYQAALICDWEVLAAEAQTIAVLGMEGPVVRPFVLLALEDRPEQHRIRAERFCRERFALPKPLPIVRPSVRTDRIRIGYFSANFHNHAVMYLIAKLLDVHDRSQFCVHAYSYGPHASDAMRIRAREAVEVFHDVDGMGERAIAEQARKDGIAIAIDLMGYTENARSEIFAQRAAPIQINYLGYPGTMGAPFMDYMIADRTLIPEGHERYYSEKIIYLPHSFMPSDNEREISSRMVTRTDMGLPEQGVVFCCFNNIYKIGAQEFGIWMRLLGQVEGSVLWLGGTNDHARHNLRNAAKTQKIDPNRVIFADRLAMPDHLARHRLADLFVDTFHYNAHSTASDALWAGLPIVTMSGEGFPARVGASLLEAVGLPELITTSADEYERLVLKLATHPDRLQALTAKLSGLRRNAPLFDSEGFARNLEDGYRQAYQRYCEGKAPETLIVSGYK